MTTGTAGLDPDELPAMRELRRRELARHLEHVAEIRADLESLGEPQPDIFETELEVVPGTMRIEIPPGADPREVYAVLRSHAEDWRVEHRTVVAETEVADGAA